MTKHLMVTILLLVASVSLGICSELLEYKVSGINVTTNERVVGNIVYSTQDGTVNGTIWDRTWTFPVNGEWSGKGMMTLHSTTAVFQVEVVE